MFSRTTYAAARSAAKRLIHEALETRHSYPICMICFTQSFTTQMFWWNFSGIKSPFNMLVLSCDYTLKGQREGSKTDQIIISHGENHTLPLQASYGTHFVSSKRDMCLKPVIFMLCVIPGCNKQFRLEVTLYMNLNPLRAKFLRENINISLHFMSFLHTNKTQVAEIPPRVRRRPAYSTESIS